MNGGKDLLAAMRSALGPAASEIDPVQAAARVAWSTIAEPGDAVAGELVTALGADRALGLVLQAVDDGAARGHIDGAARGHIDGAASGHIGGVARGETGGETGGLAELARECAESGVPGSEDPGAFAAVLRAALERWVPRLGRTDVGEVVAAARAVGARLLVPGGPTWPERVDDLGAHAPLVLWSRSAATEALPALAVVGSRANTVAGAEAAAEITSIAADAGCAIVSGGAYGIDAVAHRVAIAAGAPTVAVLAGGIDQLYPAGNVELLRNVARQGVLLAESPPGTRPTRWRFLARNRLIAALGDATVVVEAGARSGALNTAHHAGQLGRAVFAVPGAFSSSASVGCHRLVVQGRAQLVVHPRDPSDAVLSSGLRAVPGAVDEPLVGARHDPEVLRVLDALGRRAMSEHEVAGRSGMSLAETADALALAQLQGLVAHTSGGWVRA